MKPISSFIGYGRDSAISNMFDVLSLYATTNDEIRFSLGDSPIVITPITPAIDTAKWNYISVYIKTTKSATSAQMYVLVSIAPGRSGTLVKAAEQTVNMPTFNNFKNIIHLGSMSETTPNSFDGYLKEFRIYKRVAKSNDVPKLISDWILSESYNSSSSYYTIQDSANIANNVTVYLSTHPNYPSYVEDVSIALNICHYHPVADCLTVDKTNGKLAKFVFAPWRYSKAPALNLGDSSITIKNGDQLTFALKRDCLDHKAKLLRKYNAWREDDTNPEGTDALADGTHYFLCYYDSTMKVTFPLAQIYVGYIIDKITPTELSSFRTPGVTESWQFEGGDQSFGDTIMFSTDCNAPASTDMKITRKLIGTQIRYKTVTILDFAAHQKVFFCFRSAFQDPTDLTYDSIRYMEYKIVERPQVTTLNQFTLTMNYDTKKLDLRGPLSEYDQILMSWKGESFAD